MISPLFVKGNCLGYDRGVQFFAKSYSIANVALMLLLVINIWNECLYGVIFLASGTRISNDV
jgi:hypothetical protein